MTKAYFPHRCQPRTTLCRRTLTGHHESGLLGACQLISSPLQALGMSSANPKLGTIDPNLGSPSSQTALTRAITAAPAFEELRGLVVKASGLVEALIMATAAVELPVEGFPAQTSYHGRCALDFSGGSQGCTPAPSPIKRFHLPFQRNQQRPAFPVLRLARGDLHPTFADAVLLHVMALVAVQADADVVLKHRSMVMFAGRVHTEVVRQVGPLGGGGLFWAGFGHGGILPD